MIFFFFVNERNGSVEGDRGVAGAELVNMNFRRSLDGKLIRVLSTILH